MEIFEIKRELKNFNSNLNKIKENVNYDNLNKSCEAIKKEMDSDGFWEDHKKASLLSKELKQKNSLLKEINLLKEKLEDLEFLIIEMSFEKEEIKKLYDIILKDMDELEVKSLLNEEHDENDCFLEIHPGAGGVESHDFALMLFNMYEKYFQKSGIEYDIVEYNKGDVAGIKSILIKIKTYNAYGFFKRESGVHRLIRLSPFDSDKRRHTSFASVKVTPLLEEVDKTIEEKDLKIDTYRSSGAGGQSVNTTDSAIRITHIPSKIVVTCQNQRSQIQNKEEALKILKSKLLLLEEEERNKKKNELIGEVKNNSFGSQKRTYTLHPYKLVKDHISGYESSQAEKVLQGDIKEFLYSNLVSKNKRG